MFHVSASGSAAIQSVTGKRCPESNGVAVMQASRGYFAGNVGRVTVLDGADQPIRKMAAAYGLDRSRRSRYAMQVPITSGDQQVYARLVTSDGVFDSVRPVAGGGTDGVWVSEQLARLHGLQPGDPFVVGPFRTKVAAVYPTITDPVGDYWCSQRSEVLPLLLVGDLPTLRRPPACRSRSTSCCCGRARSRPTARRPKSWPRRPPWSAPTRRR
jgi:putative ABC transport system permease protein